MSGICRKSVAVCRNGESISRKFDIKGKTNKHVEEKCGKNKEKISKNFKEDRYKNLRKYGEYWNNI